MGLHPEALSILARVIQEVSLDKKLQFFITTHSRDFLDALPRDARLLINRTDESVEAVNSPTTIYAISKMSRSPTAEMVIYCEDYVAESIIRYSAKGIQNRIVCTGIGSKTELVKAAKFHELNGDPRSYMIIWDGDVTDSEIEQYKGNETFKYTRLPGGIPPEKWIINSLNNQDGITCLSDFLSQNEQEVRRLLEMANSTSDCHEIFYRISEKIACDEKEVITSFCKALLKVNTQELSELREEIEGALNDIPS